MARNKDIVYSKLSYILFNYSIMYKILENSLSFIYKIKA